MERLQGSPNERPYLRGTLRHRPDSRSPKFQENGALLAAVEMPNILAKKSFE